MGRRCVIAGNWKMYKTVDESVAFVNSLSRDVDALDVTLMLAVPFTSIGPMKQAVGERSIHIGAQNMNDATEGAFTGEIAARMLLDVGAEFVLLGHSERRHVFGEDDTYINRKMERALAEGLAPLLCIGETLEQREAGQTAEVLKQQLSGGLHGVSAEQMQGIVVAYEPVWAIGTGKTATPEMAQETHQQVRAILADLYDGQTADSTEILYGGSVKPANAAALLAQNDIDGVLVGGASLEAEDFAAIAHASRGETVPPAEKAEESTGVEE